MIPALARFVGALRAEGVTVSPAEILDASRALDAVGLDERAAVKAALRATLAKDRRSQQTFDAVFASFFTPPRGVAGGEGAGRPGAAGDRKDAGALDRAGGPQRAPSPKEPAMPRRSVRNGRPGAEPPKTPPRIDRDLARTPVSSPASGGRRDGRLRKVLSTRGVPAAPGDPVRADLARRMTLDEERRIAREVPALVQAIRLHAGRRLTRARSGRPWLRRALRESLATGGVAFVLPFRAKRKRQARVVLLVDVSHSVARAAGLFLLMAGEFLTLGRRTRVLAFVDTPVDVTAAIARWTAGRGAAADPAEAPRGRRVARPGDGIVAHGVAFSDLLAGIPGLNLDAPSDYGRALHALLAGRRRPHGRDTILVVLGDGRTNRFDPLAWALDELARGCRATLWLAPEPASRWGTADSRLPAYLPFVDVLAETNDLAGLARGLGALVRRL